MKVTITLCLVIVAQIIGLASCATVPKKTSPEDCLVLIRTTLINETGQASVRDYSFYFSDDIKPVIVDDRNNSFTMVRVRKAGVMLVKLHSKIVSSDFSGAESNQDTDFDLPYKAGQVIIADFAFVRRIVGNRDIGIMIYTDFKRLSPEEKDALMEEAVKNKIIQKWEGNQGSTQ